MHGLSDEEAEFLGVLVRIENPTVRYFFMMLGEAIAETCSAPQYPRTAVNNSKVEKIVQQRRS